MYKIHSEWYSYVLTVYVVFVVPADDDDDDGRW